MKGAVMALPPIDEVSQPRLADRVQRRAAAHVPRPSAKGGGSVCALVMSESHTSLARELQRALMAEDIVAAPVTYGLDLDELIALPELGMVILDGTSTGPALAWCAAFSARRPTLLTVVLANADEASFEAEAYAAGARLCLRAPYQVDRVSMVLGAILGRPRSRVVHGPLTIEIERRAVYLDGHTVFLSAVEFDLLLSLVRNAGKVIPFHELATSVLHNASGRGLENRVRQRVYQLSRKLGGAGAMIRSVRSVGYCFDCIRKE